MTFLQSYHRQHQAEISWRAMWHGLFGIQQYPRCPFGRDPRRLVASSRTFEEGGPGSANSTPTDHLIVIVMAFYDRRIRVFKVPVSDFETIAMMRHHITEQIEVTDEMLAAWKAKARDSAAEDF